MTSANGSLTPAPSRVSETMVPAESRITRRARAASAGSCVTSTSVVPGVAVQLDQQVDHGAAGFGVEAAGGLVGEQDPWLAPAKARASPTRCCSPPESWAGIVVQPVAQPHALEQAARARACGCRPLPAAWPRSSIGTRTFSSAVRVGISWKVWNTNPTFSARSRARASSESAPRSSPSSRTVPRRRPVEPGEQAEQRRLAAPRGPHDGHELSGRDREVNLPQHRERPAAALVGLLQVQGFDHHAANNSGHGAGGARRRLRHGARRRRPSRAPRSLDTAPRSRRAGGRPAGGAVLRHQPHRRARPRPRISLSGAAAAQDRLGGTPRSGW